MTFIKNLLLYICLGSLPAAFAGPVELYMQKYREEQQPLLHSKNIEEGHFSQLIDHNNPSLGTFEQRYYSDESFGKAKNSPVFFYICGESACTKRALNGSIREHAKKYNAKLIALEHRYYGTSIPTRSFSTQDLRHLSTEIALDDLAAFQRYFSKEKNWKGKWIAFGGSYPGALSAFYRLKFPYLVHGALASSAPVMAKEDFYEYDEHVTTVAGPQCANTMRGVVREIEQAMHDKARFAEIKELFSAAEVNDPLDFIYLVADVGATAVQYGMKNTFCTMLNTSSSPIEGYAAFAKKIYEKMNVKAVDFTAQGAMSENPEDYSNGIGMRQWYYQSCKEYGFWQNAHPDRSKSTRSALINLDYHHKICQRLFDLRKPADTRAFNANFYQPLLGDFVSAIYFTNGEQDPWSKLSISEENGNAVNPKLNYYTIAAAAHCEDLHASTANDSEYLVYSRTLMDYLIGEWLELSHS